MDRSEPSHGHSKDVALAITKIIFNILVYIDKIFKKKNPSVVLTNTENINILCSE